MEKEQTFDCLCIKSIDYKENDKLVTLYAFGKGKISASLKGVKKAKAKLKYASALFCFGKYYLTGRNGYYSVIGCDQIDSFYDIWTDIDKYYTAICTLELLDKIADDREIADKLALLTLDFLNEICYKTENTFLPFASYLSNVIKILGYSLVPICLNCGEDSNDRLFYSFLRGGLVCPDCKESTAMALPQNAVKLIATLDCEQIDNINNYMTDGLSFQDSDVFVVIRVMLDIISKNLAKTFKTFEEYILFYNKINNF